LQQIQLARSLPQQNHGRISASPRSEQRGKQRETKTLVTNGHTVHGRDFLFSMKQLETMKPTKICDPKTATQMQQDFVAKMRKK